MLEPGGDDLRRPRANIMQHVPRIKTKNTAPGNESVCVSLNEEDWMFAYRQHSLRLQTLESVYALQRQLVHLQ